MAKKKEEEKTQRDNCAICQDLACDSCNFQQEIDGIVVWSGCRDFDTCEHKTEICGNDKGCLTCRIFQDEKKKRNANRDKDETEKSSPAAEPEVPVEFYNYRAALKKFLTDKDGLEYSISSLKTQLKAVEKRIDEMNKQFANGEYTGELFAQAPAKNENPIEASPRPKREDGPEYEIYLKLVGQEFEATTAEGRLIRDGDETQQAALYEFILNNPDSATARLLYSTKDVFELDDEETDSWEFWPGEFWEGLDYTDEDFLHEKIVEADREKMRSLLEKWKGISEERHKKFAEEKGLKISKRKRGNLNA